MIPQNYITEWSNNAPWQDNSQIEQDLILSRAIVDIFNNKILKKNLVFRGGTALHKLFSPTQDRYSEDLDFVQKESIPIGEVLNEIHKTLDHWLGKPKWKQTQGRVTLYYRYESEILPVKKMKIKIEINTREHYSCLPLIELPFAIKSSWFSGDTLVHTYALEELLGTKLRALYQRKKGRDLFDFYSIMNHSTNLDFMKIVKCFKFYINKENLEISYDAFNKNMKLKLEDPLFLNDIFPLLRDTESYDQIQAYKKVHEALISKLK